MITWELSSLKNIEEFVMNIEERLLFDISKNNKYIILDVDRTIISGTAWFRACSTPNLLINDIEIEEFLLLNSLTYDQMTMSVEKFRKHTLHLILKRIQKIFLDSQNSVDELFYSSAKKIVKDMNYYRACANCIIELKKKYDDKLCIIFLSSGYRCFIKGVVDTFLNLFFEEKINYYVLGSEVEYDGFQLTETYFISQDNKEKITRFLASKDAKIIMLADDSNENPNLFNFVTRQGGLALKIDYQKGQLSSKVWEEALVSIKKEILLDFYRNQNDSTKLLKKESLNTFVAFLDQQTDVIGISRLNIEDYDSLMSELNEVLSKKSYSKYKQNLNELFFTKDNFVYLRGPLYYYWIPSGNSNQSEVVFNKFKKLVNLLCNIQEILVGSVLFERIKCSNISNLLLLSILEHFQHVYLVVLNMIEKAEIDKNKPEIMHKHIEKQIQKITDLIFEILELKFDFNKLTSLFLELDLAMLFENFCKHFKYHQGMRELDNIVSIYHSIKYIVSSEQEFNFDYLVQFFYGGSVLGYSIVSYLKANSITKHIPKLLNSHYSSKKEKRFGTKLDVDYFIPFSHLIYLSKIKSGNNRILLFDNNSTTLKTLKEVKIFLEHYHNTVNCAVVSFNYVNLVNFKLNLEPYEEVIEDWEDILNYQPAEEYITAFDTWGTSQKGNYLQNKFRED